MQNHRLLDKFGAFDDVTVNACLLGLKVVVTTLYGIDHNMSGGTGNHWWGQPSQGVCRFSGAFLVDGGG